MNIFHGGDKITTQSISAIYSSWIVCSSFQGKTRIWYISRKTIGNRKIVQVIFGKYNILSLYGSPTTQETTSGLSCNFFLSKLELIISHADTYRSTMQREIYVRVGIRVRYESCFYQLLELSELLHLKFGLEVLFLWRTQGWIQCRRPSNESPFTTLTASSKLLQSSLSLKGVQTSWTKYWWRNTWPLSRVAQLSDSYEPGSPRNLHQISIKKH